MIEKLTHLRQLNAAEMAAVQNLYFAPRADLAAFSSYFTTFGEAESFLLQESDEAERWRYFQRQFALTYKRCRMIADHLAEHVASITRQKAEDCGREAWLLLQNLFADGNMAKTPWENDSGQVPLVTWQTSPDGGAFSNSAGIDRHGSAGRILRCQWRVGVARVARPDHCIRP